MLGTASTHPEFDMRRVTLPRCSSVPPLSVASCCCCCCCCGGTADDQPLPICSTGAPPCFVAPASDCLRLVEVVALSCSATPARLRLPRSCGPPPRAVSLLPCGLTRAAPAGRSKAVAANPVMPVIDSERRGVALRLSLCICWGFGFWPASSRQTLRMLVSQMIVHVDTGVGKPPWHACMQKSCWFPCQLQPWELSYLL